MTDYSYRAPQIGDLVMRLSDLESETPHQLELSLSGPPNRQRKIIGVVKKFSTCGPDETMTLVHWNSLQTAFSYQVNRVGKWKGPQQAPKDKLETWEYTKALAVVSSNVDDLLTEED